MAFVPRHGGQSGGAEEAPTHCVCIHYLTLLEDSTGLNGDIAAIALGREADSTSGHAGSGGASGSLDSSNVNGFHSDRSLAKWGEDRLPRLLKDALGSVQQVEAQLRTVGVQGCSLEGANPVGSDSAQDGPAELTEMWLNVSRDGAWNMLHTHPGSRFSGSYYVSDGGALRRGGGQLMLLVTAPPQLGAHIETHLGRPWGG